MKPGPEETITSTIVERIQIDARPAPFLFIRYTIEEMDTKRTINGSVSSEGSVMVLFRIGLRAGG